MQHRKVYFPVLHRFLLVSAADADKLALGAISMNTVVACDEPRFKRENLYYLECSHTLIAQILDLVNCWEINKSELRLSAIAEFLVIISICCLPKFKSTNLRICVNNIRHKGLIRIR